MTNQNYRIVKSDHGFSLHLIVYDSYGQPCSWSKTPEMGIYADSICELIDHIENIQLAFEKTSLDKKIFDNIADS